MDVGTLDELAVDGRRVAVRVDVNSPLDGDELADDARLQAHVDTLDELADRGGRVVVLAHQGRPGGDDFGSLAPHAERLDALLDAPVTHVDALFGSAAHEAVADVGPGEVLLLENTRFYSEEYMTWEPAGAAGTVFVADLAPAFDAYVNDAFAAAHRSQPSIVGFPERLPAYAGRVMERELAVLGDIESTARPRVFVLGGAKVDDSLDVAERVLDGGLADEVLTAGLVGNVFLLADGVDLGDATASIVHERGYSEQLDRAANLLDAHGDAIRLPMDVAVERDGAREELGIVVPPEEGEAAMDVGHRTVERYRASIEEAGTVVLNGPAGVVEDDLFRAGTVGIYGAAADADYSVVGGGDTAAALRRLGVEGFDHVSTGGGACLQLLTGQELPAVESLRRNRP
jgi:phosphoglycerate kinase